MNPSDRKAPPTIVWWLVWVGIIAGLTAIYVVQSRPPPRPPVDSLRYLPIGPLALSCVVRWLVLPRFSGVRAFPIFVIGLAFAEACGFFGIFLVPSLKQEYFLLSLVALVQFVPLFLRLENA